MRDTTIELSVQKGEGLQNLPVFTTEHHLRITTCSFRGYRHGHVALRPDTQSASEGSLPPPSAHVTLPTSPTPRTTSQRASCLTCSTCPSPGPVCPGDSGALTTVPGLQPFHPRAQPCPPHRPQDSSVTWTRPRSSRPYLRLPSGPPHRGLLPRADLHGSMAWPPATIRTIPSLNVCSGPKGPQGPQTTEVVTQVTIQRPHLRATGLNVIGNPATAGHCWAIWCTDEGQTR